jgi:hypothetical protein
MAMESHRKHWNDQQKKLQAALSHPGDGSAAIKLFLGQHAMVHTADMSRSGSWSFEDEVMDGLTEADMRKVQPKGGHSIVWILYHLARCEDVTMNILVADSPQLFEAGGWAKKLKVSVCETGNALDAAGIDALSAAIDIPDLRAYRLAVARRTDEIVKKLQPGDFKQKAAPARLAKIEVQGAVDPAAHWLIEYWGGRTIAGLLLMPPTRHNFVHLNEIARLRAKL